MNAPSGSGEGREPEPPDGSAGPEPRLWRVLRSAIAPPVLDDAGHDAPLSPRGRVLFWATVGVLVLAIVVLFVATISR
jgi:hypothetical protein